ncbi:MAG: hypothetical protein NT147_03775, partial [Candidatus Aminicenantes bacterium]|nr:hypothetical protein [Candidatus Aminicenantes bacterium]
MKISAVRSACVPAMIMGLLVMSAVLRAGELKAVRVKEGPKVDGLLTDTAWQSASVVTGFRMVEPRPGDEPSEKTEAWVVYDDTSLYIGVYCHDREPGRISANTMAHDSGNVQSFTGYGHAPQTASDDVVRVLL